MDVQNTIAKLSRAYMYVQSQSTHMNRLLIRVLLHWIHYGESIVPKVSHFYALSLNANLCLEELDLGFHLQYLRNLGPVSW